MRNSLNHLQGLPLTTHLNRPTLNTHGQMLDCTSRDSRALS